MSSGVEFDEDKFRYTAPRPMVGNMPQAGGYSYSGTGGEPKMIQWLMKKGIVKSPAAGQGVLIGLVIVNIIITFIVIKFFL